MPKIVLEKIVLKSQYFDDEIEFRAVRHGSFFTISRRQYKRIPKDRGIRMMTKDHVFGEEMSVIVDDEF